MSVPLIHIGYHKTGTTWLQRQVFPEAKIGFRMIAGAREMRDYVRANPLEPLDESAGALSRAFSSGINDARESGLVPGISHERISGNPHRGGRDSKDIADKLNQAFPEARILIVIREQASMLASLYNTYIRMGGTASFEQYMFAPPEDDETPLFRFEFLEYHRLLSHY